MADVIPRKLFYKIGEVCELTDTQPYVLRFWESEFPQLAPKKSRTGQRLYRRRDIDLVLEIKKLLYQEGYTIAGARKKLGMAGGEGVLAELFEPATDTAPDGAQPVGEIAAGLRKILQVMDETDRRFKGQRRVDRK